MSDQITYVTGPMPTGITDANDIRRDAQEGLAALPAGELTGGQASAIRAAAAGTAIVFGPLTLLAGEGAIGLANNGLAARREEAARQTYLDISSRMDGVEVAAPPSASKSEKFTVTDGSQDDSGGTGGNGGGGGGGGRSRTPSVEAYPDFNVSPLESLPPGLTYSPPNENDGSSHLPDVHGDVPIIDLEPHGPQPTPDGPLGGINTMPGEGHGLVKYLPPGSGIIGAPSGPAAGLGSGLSAGLVAGAGGAAALKRLGSTPAAGGGTALSGRGAAGAGGLLGKGGAGPGGAGSGLGVRGGDTGGVGGLAGGGASAGTGTQGSAARGAGMRAGGGMAGGAGGSAQGGAGGRGGAGAGGRGAAGAGGRGMGGMGSGPGSRSDRKDQGRGLGGPIAPRMDDDEQVGPRSENAEAGGRDD